MAFFSGYDLDGIKRILPSCDTFDGRAILIQVESSSLQQSRICTASPSHLDSLTFILVERGRISLTIDYIDYSLGRGMLIDLIHNHIVSDLKVTDDFKGTVLVINSSLLEEVIENGSVPLEFVMKRRLEPVQQMDETEFFLMRDVLHRLQRNMRRTAHLYQRRLILNDLSTFLHERINLNEQQESRSKTPFKPDPKQEILYKLLRLIRDHCKSEHLIHFYACQLCITPEYLSRQVKAASGKTVNQWISLGRLTEAKIMLRQLDISLQQIADKLRFSDHSSFGKFFRKHSGFTPMEYRKRYNL